MRMLWDIVNGWVDGYRDPLPKKDGTYYVAQIRYSDVLEIDTMHYTVEYGWNTTNESANRCPIDMADGRQFWWTPAIKVTIEEATK